MFPFLVLTFCIVLILFVSFYGKYLILIFEFYAYLIGKVLKIHSLEVRDFGSKIFSEYSGAEQIIHLQNVWFTLFLFISIILLLSTVMIFRRLDLFTNILVCFKKKDVLFISVFFILFIFLLVEIHLSISFSHCSLLTLFDYHEPSEIQRKLILALKIRAYISTIYKLLFFIILFNTPGNAFLKSFSVYCILILLRGLDNFSCEIFDLSIILTMSCVPCGSVLIDFIKTTFNYFSWLFCSDNMKKEEIIGNPKELSPAPIQNYDLKTGQKSVKPTFVPSAEEDPCNAIIREWHDCLDRINNKES